MYEPRRPLGQLRRRWLLLLPAAPLLLVLLLLEHVGCGRSRRCLLRMQLLLLPLPLRLGKQICLRRCCLRLYCRRRLLLLLVAAAVGRGRCL